MVIVGGSGFIGTRLCARLKLKEKSFKILDKVQSLDFQSLCVYADVGNPIDPRLLLNAGVIVNLAAEHRDDVTPKSLYGRTNVEGARNICIAARQSGVQKIIFTSSVAVYGFAPVGTNEGGNINPFNDYGRTKWEAEKIYREWQLEDPENRTLIVIRPTVVFGEKNRGNVYNLLKQISSGKFVMIGSGFNRKSLAYVENVAAFIEHSFSFKPGLHIYNYIDKPDFQMNQLVSHVNKLLGKKPEVGIRIPYSIGITIGKVFDLIALMSRKKLSISSVRIRKFCANSVYETAIGATGFNPPVHLIDAIAKTVQYEFMEKDRGNEQVFFSE